MIKVKFKESLEVRLTSAFVLIIAIAIITMTITIYNKSYNLFVSNLSARSAKTAELVAKKINVEEFNKLKTVEDEKTEGYKKIKQQLMSIKEASGAKFVYAMKKNENGQYIYVVDGTDFNDKNMSHIGDVENQVDKGYIEVYKGSAYTSEKINVISWGVLVSSQYPLKNSNNEVVGFIAADYDVAKEYSAFQKFKIQLILIALCVLIVTSIFGIIVSKKVSNPIIKVTELLNKIASLDLTNNSNYEPLLKRKGEIGVMINALFNTREALRALVTAISENSKTISMHTKTLSSVSCEMASAVENVSNSIESVANGTSSQKMDLLSAANKLSDFSGDLSNIVKKIKGIYAETGEIKSMVGISSSDVEGLVQSINNINNYFNDIITKMSNLGKDVDKIYDITNIIKSIADQTNLLALNASIEAARAGESGRGFSVVADEIRKLAEQAKDSSESINLLINNISNNTNEMLQATGVMDKELSNEVASINSSVNSFKKIIQSIDEVIPKIYEVSTAATNIDKQKNTIIEKIDVVSAASEEISASTEEMSASAQEVNAAAEEVASSAYILNNMTTEMKEQVNKFKL